MKRLLVLLMILMPLVCYAKTGGHEHSVVGAWVMKSETAPDGRVTQTIYTGYTRCKIYDADSTYYSVQLHAVGDEMMIIAHEMGHYRLDDSIYMERDRVMPFEWLDDTTFVTTYEGYQELMVRSSTMTEERMEEIRELVRLHPNDGDSPVKHFVLSTTERQLRKENHLFLYIIIGMTLVAAAVMAYAYRLHQRKREVERKLAEIEEERVLRPTLVAAAMRQVETEFFQSDYYRDLRRRIEAGVNLSPQEWQELEQRLKSVYPRFSSTLYGLFNLSPAEFQMCMLLKVRTSPAEIAAVLKRDKSTISSMRRRLYKKVFGKDGSGRDWDEFVLTL